MHPKENYKSWSDLRKRQLELLAPALHGRVDYHLARYHQVHNSYGHAAILVDGQAAVTFSWVEMYEQELYNYDEAHLPRWENDATFSDYEFIDALTAYRHLSIADALLHEDVIIRVFALLDRRTGTLITGDCLQVFGIYGSGAWGAVICWQKLHLEALKKLDAMDIQAILAAHDYHPYGQTVFGQEAVKAYIGGCLEALLRIRDILKDNQEKTDEEVTEICNDGSLPTVPVKVVTNMRSLLEQGGI